MYNYDDGSKLELTFVDIRTNQLVQFAKHPWSNIELFAFVGVNRIKDLTVIASAGSIRVYREDTLICCHILTPPQIRIRDQYIASQVAKKMKQINSH